MLSCFSACKLFHAGDKQIRIDWAEISYEFETQNDLYVEWDKSASKQEVTMIWMLKFWLDRDYNKKE